MGSPIYPQPASVYDFVHDHCKLERERESARERESRQKGKMQKSERDRESIYTALTLETKMILPCEARSAEETACVKYI